MFLKDLKKEYNIIDIRDKYSYELGHVYNAVNIPMDILLNNPSKYLNKNETYYLLCQTGRQSLDIVNMLNIQGFRTVNIIGGYNNYLLSK